jgi:hypothetical protein
MIPASANARLAQDIMMGRSPETKETSVRMKPVCFFNQKVLFLQKVIKASVKQMIGKRYKIYHHIVFPVLDRQMW